MTSEAIVLDDDSLFGGVTEQVVEVNGVPASALCAWASEPRAVVVAVHGGATSSRYFDFPGRPWLSLLRIGAALGFTVLSVDRPGYGACAAYGDMFDSPQQRVDTCFAAVDALLEGRPRGAGVFLAGHSAGCDLAGRMAADPRGAQLLGVELAGTGIRKDPEAARRIADMRPDRGRSAVRELLWYPRQWYPAEIYGGKPIAAAAPRYEAEVVNRWPAELPDVAARVRIPVRFTHAEHERVWRTDPEALAEIRESFSSTPRFVLNCQAGSGHNLSVGLGAAAYHLGLLAFVEECVVRPEQGSAGPGKVGGLS